MPGGWGLPAKATPHWLILAPLPLRAMLCAIEPIRDHLMWKKLLAENEKVYHTLALFIYSLVIASVSPWCPQILYLRIQPITGQRYSWGGSAFCTEHIKTISFLIPRQYSFCLPYLLQYSFVKNWLEDSQAQRCDVYLVITAVWKDQLSPRVHD